MLKIVGIFYVLNKGVIMGTPCLKPLTVAEKIVLLNAGMEIGKKMDIKELPKILDMIKSILLPLTKWLDKPFVEIFANSLKDLPSAFHKKRGMVVVDNYSIVHSFLTIILQRNGKWFVRNTHYKWEGEAYIEVDSFGLSDFIIKQADIILRLSFQPPVDDNVIKYLLEEIRFPKEILIYNFILYSLNWFSEAINEVIKEREERLRIMRQRMDVMRDFLISLDPFLSNVEKIGLTEYSIRQRMEDEGWRDTANYLTEEALQQIWDIINERRDKDSFSLEKNIIRIDSLVSFLRRLSFLVEDIIKARENDSMDIKSLFNYDGKEKRLPITDGEIEITSNLIDSIRHAK